MMRWRILYIILNLSQKTAEDKPDAIVSIILDGENAWEYYPENGYHFLSALYEKLGQHKELKLTTYSEYLESNSDKQHCRKLLQEAGSMAHFQPG